MIGINLSGAEFGKIGDAYGVGYTYPSAADINYYAAQGVSFVRLPVRWERLQPALGGTIDPAELARLNKFLDNAAAAGVKVIVDVHNYGSYNGKKIGTADVPASQFADFWKKLATAIHDKPAVLGYDLMNEPVGLGVVANWQAAAQGAVDAIRTVDMTHNIYVEGIGYATAAKWTNNNASLDIRDPADKIVYEAHIYFDKNYSGTYQGTYDSEGATPEMGAQRIQNFVDWLAAKGAKGFIGEFAVPDNDPRWLTVLDNAMTAMKAAGLDAAYWGAGPWWGNYPMALRNLDGTASTQLPVLLNHVQADNAEQAAASAAAQAVADAAAHAAQAAADAAAQAAAAVAAHVAAQAAGQSPLGTHTDAPVAATPAAVAPAMTLHVDNDFLYRQYDGNAAQAAAALGASAIHFEDGTLSFSQDGIAAEIYRLYDSVLRRAPDPQGFDYWYETREHGISLQTVANGFLQSDEMIHATGQLSDPDFVEYLYNHSLGRASDPDGKQFWIDALAHGQSRADLLVGFSESVEHRAATASGIAHGIFISDDSYEQIARLYDTFGARLPDAAGLVSWAEALKSGQSSLASIADGFAASAEFQSRIVGMSHGQIVDMIYHNTLHRDPDAAGRQSWVDGLDHGMSLGSLLLGFSESQEHQMLTAPHIYNGIDVI